MMFQRWQSAREETVTDLNVVPVMNLFMVLIPFLLLGAAFYHVGVIPASTPTHDPHESDVPKTPRTVAINLVVTPNSLKMTAASTSLEPEALQALSREFPSRDGKYATEQLQAALSDIKDRYPESNTLTALPHDDLQYQELVAILDATRERQTGVDAVGDPVFRELFPVTVFSKLLREEQKEMRFDVEEEP